MRRGNRYLACVLRDALKPTFMHKIRKNAPAFLQDRGVRLTDVERALQQAQDI